MGKSGYVRLIIILIIISGAVQNVSGQEVYDLNKHLTQPEYSSFVEYDKPEVDAQGNLNLTIPLGTIEGRGIDYPVTLTYQSGIKVLSPSSWVGLGWDFNPGSITRTPTIGPFTDGNHNGVDVFDNSGNNNTPDKFIITLPGRGSTEMVQVGQPSFTSYTLPQYTTGEFLTLDQKAWEIEFKMGFVTKGGISTGVEDRVYDIIMPEKDFTKFLVTVEDGTRYLFEKPTLAYVDVQYNNEVKTQVYVATWRLIAIFGADFIGDTWNTPSVSDKGAWIKLDYDQLHTHIKDQSYDEFRQTQYLASITTPVGTATFTTQERMEPMLQEWEMLPNSYENSTQRQLTKVNFPDGKMVEFVQDNEFNPAPDNTTIGRLRLKGLSFKGTNGGQLPGYSFEYVENPDIYWTGDSFAQMTTCMDEFGFINESELGWVDSTYPGTCSGPSNPNSGSDSWSLSSITYPTGLVDEIEYETRSVKGSTEIEFYTREAYQPDIYKPDFSASSSEDVYIGGPKVKKIIRSSSTNEKYLEEYKYEEPQLYIIPNAFFKRRTIGNYNRLFAGNNTEAAIYHGYVTTSYFGNEKTEVESIRRNEFKLSDKPLILYYSNAGMNCPGVPDDAFDSNNCAAQYIWSENEKKGLGRLVSSTYMNPDSVILKKKNIIYATGSRGLINKVWTLRENFSEDVIRTVRLYQWNNKIESIETLDGAELTKILYEYDYATNLVKKEKKRLTSDKYQIKKITRAHEVSQYSEMKNRNMLTQTVREDLGMEEGGNTKWKSGNVTSWKDTGIDTDPLYWKPWKSFSWKSDQTKSGSPIGFSAWTSGSTPSGWILNEEMKHYDLHGNLTQRVFPNGTKVDYTYSHNESKLSSAKLVEGVSSNPLSLEVKLWYNNPFRKVSRTMDQFGVNQYFNYDEHGRLKEVKNHNQALVSSYDYIYGLAFSNYTLNKITETSYTNAADTSENFKIYSYYDGMARLRQSLTESGNDYIVKHFDYNNMGFLEKEWKPYLDQTASNGNFVLPTNARSRATQYYKSELGLSYNPHPYTRTEYYGISVPKVHKQYPAWTDNEVYVEHASGLDLDNSITQINGQNVRFSRTRDENGNKTAAYRNHLGEVVRKVVAQNSAVEMETDFEYDEVGNMIKSTSPRGLETTYDYNTLGQLTSKNLPDHDDAVDYKYDNAGNLRFVRDANHKSEKDDHQVALNGDEYIEKTITATSDGVLTLQLYFWNAFSGYEMRIEHIENGNAIVFEEDFPTEGYIGDYNPVIIPVEAGTYRFVGYAPPPYYATVKPSGTLGFISNDTYTYTKYDKLGRPIETGEYSGSVDFASANPNDANFPTSDHQANIKYYYDGDHTPYSGSYVPNHANGQLTKVSYRDLSTTSTNNWGHDWFSYNELGLVEWKYSQPFGLSAKLIQYHYDEFGRLTRRDYQPNVSAERFITWQEYDELGRLQYVYTDTDTNPSGRTKEAEYTYTADGQVKKLDLGYDPFFVPSVHNSYNIRGWLTERNSSKYHSMNWHYGFNMELRYRANGTISKQTWLQGGGDPSQTVSYTYTYDAANRLKNAKFSGPSYYNINALHVYYTYDKDGNIKHYSRWDENGYLGENDRGFMDLFINSNSNRIDYLRDGLSYITYDTDYDANGNMIENELNGFESVQYDWRNLPSVMMAGGSTLTYAYNADGQRIKKKMGSTETHYIRDTDGKVLAVYVNGVLEYQNMFAVNDMIGTYDGNQRRYYLKDHLGSIRATISEVGGASGYYDYYPFGLQMPGRSSNSSNVGGNKFTGHERDDEANLTLDYMIARNYDPEIGRFLQVDPKHDHPALVGLSPYNYALNNPIKYNDPDGKCPPIICGAIAGATLDYAIQVGTNLAAGKGLRGALTDIDGKSIAVSAGAGAVGAGVVSKGGKLLNLVRGGAKVDDIVSATTKLDDIASKAAGLVDDATKQPVKGTNIHTKFAELVKKEFGENAATEVSFKAGKLVPHGTKGSVRIDALVKNSNGKPLGIFDLKTGKAGITYKRINQIRDHLPDNLKDLPIKEIRGY